MFNRRFLSTFEFENLIPNSIGMIKKLLKKLLARNPFKKTA